MYQPFAVSLNNSEKGKQLIDVFFKNWKQAESDFTTIQENFKTGYPVDIWYESESDAATLYFQFAIPGVNPDDVLITKSKDGDLRVKYERTDADDDKRRYVSRAISRKSFDLAWKIPRRFDVDSLEANFYQGLLTIKIPRSQSSLPETVKINVTE